MKKTLQLSLLIMFVLAAFNNPLRAQVYRQEMLMLTKQFEQAYNKKDDKALQSMFTENATKTNADGSVIKGKKAIGSAYAQEFKETETLTLIAGKAITKANGTVWATGTYQVKAKDKTGKPYKVQGRYSNTLVKESGQWKIAKTALTNI